MPEPYLWGLVVSLGMLAFGLSLKLAEVKHRIKLADDEVSHFLREIDSLNKEHQKRISDVSEFHAAREKKIVEEYIHKIELLQKSLMGSGKPLGLGSYMLLQKERRP